MRFFPGFVIFFGVAFGLGQGALAPAARAALSSCANYDEDTGDIVPDTDTKKATPIDGSPGNACGQCEPKLVNVIDGPGGLLEQAKTGKLNSVEEFLGALSKDKYGKTLFKNSILINNSRSAQATDAKSGGFRYMMKSREGDVAFGVTNAKGQKGYNTLEFVIWNGKEGRYEMRSLCFPKEGACTTEQGAAVAATGKPTVHGSGDKPPESCVQCHNNPPRPNWDTYRFWSGSIPMNPDRLVFPSAEASWYVATMKANKNDPRMKFLEPPLAHSADYNPGGPTQFTLANMENLVEQFDKAIKAKKPITPVVLQLEHDPKRNVSGFGSESDPPSVRYFDQSNFRNTCRIPTEQKKLPTKYAFAGAFKGCGGDDPVSAFIPPEQQKKAAEFFNAKGIGSGGKVTYADVLKDSWKKSNQHYIKKLVLQLDTMIARFKGDRKKAEAELGYTLASLSTLWKMSEDPSGPLQSGTISSSEVVTASTFPADAPKKDYAQVPPNQANGGDVEAMARTRLLLEPQGVPVDQWSMSVDFGKPQIADQKFFYDDAYANKTFSFADIYLRYMGDAPMFRDSPYSSPPVESELTKECKVDQDRDSTIKCDPSGMCDWLAKKSLASLAGPVRAVAGAPAAPAVDFDQFQKVCTEKGKIDSDDMVPAGVKGASAAARKILQEKAAKTYKKCLSCHSDGGIKPDNKEKADLYQTMGRTNEFFKLDDLAKVKAFLNESPPVSRQGTENVKSKRTWLQLIAIATDPEHLKKADQKDVPSMPDGMAGLTDPEERAVFLGYLTSIALSDPRAGGPKYACEMLADRMTGNPLSAGDAKIDSTPMGGAGQGSGGSNPASDNPYDDPAPVPGNPGGTNSPIAPKNTLGP